MMAHRSTTRLRVRDPSTQRVADAFIALASGVSTVSLIGLYLVRRPSPTRTVKRSLIAAQ